MNEHFRRRDFVYLMAVALGMVGCFMGRPEASVTAPDPALGNTLAVMCSITWAFTLVALRYIERDHSRPGLGMSAVVLGNAFASVAALPFAWPFPAASTGEWLTIVYLGVGQIGLAYVPNGGHQTPVGARSLVATAHRTGAESGLDVDSSWRASRTWTIAGGAIIVSATALRSLHDARASPTYPAG